RSIAAHADPAKLAVLKRLMPQTATDRLLRPLPRLQPNSGLPEFGHVLTGRSRINPTSAWRDREGARRKIERARAPLSPPLPCKRERERTESAALSVDYSLHAVPSPLVPAKAGTQIGNLDSRHKRVYARLPRAMRGNERKERRVGKGANRSARSAAGAPCPRGEKTIMSLHVACPAAVGKHARGQRRSRRAHPTRAQHHRIPCPFHSQACWWCRSSRRWRRLCAPAGLPTPAPPWSRSGG